MRKIITVVALVLTICSCNSQDEKRMAVISALDSMGHDVFTKQYFSYKSSGIMKTWYKKISDDSVYSCLIASVPQQEEITITYPGLFVRERKLPFDMRQTLTSKVYRYRDSIVFTRLNLREGRYEKAGMLEKQETALFLSVNAAFDSLNNMGKKMDRIGIREVLANNSRIIYIRPDGEMLVYLFDNIKESEKKKHTEGCEMIKPNWWLYKGKK